MWISEWFIIVNANTNLKDREKKHKHNDINSQENIL
jgi:hypothetical protein